MAGEPLCPTNRTKGWPYKWLCEVLSLFFSPLRRSQAGACLLSIR